MGLPFRRLLKDIAIYGLGDILLRATAFITIPIYTRIFTPEDYGIWSFVATAAGLLSSVLILGGDSAYARFFFEAKTHRERQVVTSSWLGFLAIWSGGVIVLCLPFTSVFSQWSFGTPQHTILFMLALLTAPVGLINIMCSQVLRNQFRARLFTMLSIVSTLLSVGLSLVGVVILNLGLVGVIGGALLAATLMLPLWLWTARDMLRPQFSHRVLRSMLGYGVPLVPMSLAYWVFASSDRFVLGKLSTLDQLGLYAVANNAASILGFVNAAVGQAWSPYAVRVAEEQPEVAPQFFGQVMTYILVGFGLLCVGLTTFAHELLLVLSTPEFLGAALAIGPLAIGFVAYASTHVTAIGISLAKKTRYFAIFSWIAAILNIALNVLLVPKWGMIASSWATAVSYVFVTVAYLITSRRLWPVVYEKRRGLMVVVLTLAFTVAAPFLPSFNLLADLALKSTYCLAYVALLFLLQVLDRRESTALLDALQEMRIRWAGKAA